MCTNISDFNLSRDQIDALIYQWIFNERDRAISRRRLLDGIRYEKLAEEMNLVLENDSLSNRFKILPHELRYSEIMQKVPKLEERTKKFYGIN